MTAESAVVWLHDAFDIPKNKSRNKLFLSFKLLVLVLESVVFVYDMWNFVLLALGANDVKISHWIHVQLESREKIPEMNPQEEKAEEYMARWSQEKLLEFQYYDLIMIMHAFLALLILFSLIGVVQERLWILVTSSVIAVANVIASNSDNSALRHDAVDHTAANLLICLLLIPYTFAVWKVRKEEKLDTQTSAQRNGQSPP